MAGSCWIMFVGGLIGLVDGWVILGRAVGEWWVGECIVSGGVCKKVVGGWVYKKVVGVCIVDVWVVVFSS